MRLLFLLLLFRLILAQDWNELPLDKRKQLVDGLFENYNKNRQPPHNSTKAQIDVTFTVVHIDPIIDIPQQTLTVESWLRLSWIDSRLGWDTNKYKANKIHVDANSIWKPTITIFSSSSDVGSKELTENNSRRNALILPTGSVTWIPEVSTNFLCELNWTYYPFDVHKCSLQMGMWRYDSYMLHPVDTTMDLSLLLNNTEWEVVENHAERTIDKYDAFTDVAIYVTYSLSIRRARPLYQAMRVFPIAAGIVLANIAFLISAFSNKRISFMIFVLSIFIFTTLHLKSLFPSIGPHTPAVVSICDSLIILISFAIVWNVILLVGLGQLERTKLTSFAQKMLSLWPIKLIGNTNQMIKISVEVDGETEMNAIIIDQSGSTNEWHPIFVVLDRLVFITFIISVVIVLLIFCC